MNEAYSFPSPNDARIREAVSEARHQRWLVMGGATANAFKALRRTAKTAAAAVAEAYRMRELYAELSTMSDRQLADMGITRGDISAVVTGNYRRETAAPVVTLAPKARLETPAEDIRKAA